VVYNFGQADLDTAGVDFWAGVGDTVFRNEYLCLVGLAAACTKKSFYSIGILFIPAFS
jgi:hypothetical protein